MIIGAPHRGQCQAGLVEDVSERGKGRRSNRRTSASRAVRQVLREIAKLPNADKAMRQDVLYEAPEKLHRGEGHRAPLMPVRVIVHRKVTRVPSKAIKRWLLIGTRWV
jgi:hypothetical protein